MSFSTPKVVAHGSIRGGGGGEFLAYLIILSMWVSSSTTHQYISSYPTCEYQSFYLHLYCEYYDLFHQVVSIDWRAGLLITVSLVRTHSGASFVINFASLSPASAWPSLA